MKNSKFVLDKIAKLVEQGLISSKDIVNELMTILKSKRDEFEILSKRVENLERKIDKLKSQKKKVKRAKRS